MFNLMMLAMKMKTKIIVMAHPCMMSIPNHISSSKA